MSNNFSGDFNVSFLKSVGGVGARPPAPLPPVPTPM